MMTIMYKNRPDRISCLLFGLRISYDSGDNADPWRRFSLRSAALLQDWQLRPWQAGTLLTIGDHRVRREESDAACLKQTSSITFVSLGTLRED